MKKIVTSMLVCAAIFAVASCSKKDNSPSNSASVMFVNGCAGVDGIDGKVGNTNVGVSNLAFLNNSGYKSVTAGTNLSIDLIYSALGSVLAGGDGITLTANTHYSAFAGGLVTGAYLVLTTDDLTAPTAGNAKIRLVNLSADATNLTGNIGTTSFTTGVGPAQSSGFAEVPAGSYSLKAADPTNIGISADGGVQSLVAGRNYTLIMTGSSTATVPAAMFTLTLINN